MGAKGEDGLKTFGYTMTNSQYKQPTLPHLLNEYGFEDAMKERMKKRKEEERERRKAEKKKNSKGKTFDEDRDLDKQRETDEHYLKMVRDMYHLRDFYYNEYSRLLADKVEKQRKEIREKEPKLSFERQIEEEKQIKASHTVKKRLERHTIETTPSTVSVPKTDIYHIIGLEEKLRREGKLKTPSDFQKFHAEIQQPHIFYSHFKVRKHSDTTPYSDIVGDGLSSYSRGESNDTMFEMVPKLDMFQPHQHLQLSQQQNQQQQQMRSLSRIAESRENSRPNSRADNWAITQQFPSQLKSRKSVGSMQKAKADQLSDLEKRFPKLEMPKLHCFTLNLDKKPPDPEEVKIKAELKTKEKLRKQTARTFTKMYQLAMSNVAATARIMETHDDMDFLLHGPNLCDVIADEHWMKAYGMTSIDDATGGDELVQDFDGQPLDEPQPKSQGMLVNGSHNTSSRRGSAASSKQGSKKSSRRSSAQSQRSDAQEEEKEVLPPLPLTMEEITGNCNIKESKMLSTLWTNYLKAGKSPWEVDDKEDD